jgi:ferredoxin-NADP reductase
MESNIIRIKSLDKVTHDVIRIVTNKPAGYIFQPGQATELAINEIGWEEEKRPFSFTCLPENDYLEFTIKTYPSHQGVTNHLLTLKKGDELLLHEVFGAITYSKEGVFIAGGAVVTPFISIFRHLKSKNKIGNNKLLFANKTKSDIILEEEFSQMLGMNFINILSEEQVEGYAKGLISEDFLRKNISDFNQQFYVCGPPPMVEMVLKQLNQISVGKEAITIEL